MKTLTVQQSSHAALLPPPQPPVPGSHLSSEVLHVELDRHARSRYPVDRHAPSLERTAGASRNLPWPDNHCRPPRSSAIEGYRLMTEALVFQASPTNVTGFHVVIILLVTGAIHCGITL